MDKQKYIFVWFVMHYEMGQVYIPWLSEQGGSLSLTMFFANYSTPAEFSWHSFVPLWGRIYSISGEISQKSKIKKLVVVAVAVEMMMISMIIL